MAHGQFIWTDLSTFDMATARSNYSDLFGWKFAGDDAYDFAFLGDREVAAVFPMPPRLVEINMPSFWMSYVQVDELDEAVARAKSHDGVIVEVAPQAFGDDARISLVRDPSGAGFTLYEGPDIAQSQDLSGTVTARYHHVHDIAAIELFYHDLFGWEFDPIKEVPWPVFNIHHRDGSVVAQVEEVPESIRGKFRYWMPGLRVPSSEDVITKLNALGCSPSTLLTQGRHIVADQQGAHFIIQESSGCIA